MPRGREKELASCFCQHAASTSGQLGSLACLTVSSLQCKASSQVPGLELSITSAPVKWQSLNPRISHVSTTTGPLQQLSITAQYPDIPAKPCGAFSLVPTPALAILSHCFQHGLVPQALCSATSGSGNTTAFLIFTQPWVRQLLPMFTNL